MKQKAMKSQNLCYLIFKINNTKCISLQSTNRIVRIKLDPNHLILHKGKWEMEFFSNNGKKNNK